jgi:hypothetical protein
MSPVRSLRYRLLVALGTHSDHGSLWSGNRRQEESAQDCTTCISEAEARADDE